MSSPMRLFTVVRVTAIRADRFARARVFYERLPKTGDIGAIVEIHESPELAYEVECCDPAASATVWLEAMYPDEVEEVLDESATS